MAMADDGGNSMALVHACLVESEVAPPRTLRQRQKWEVEYARYFGTPRRDPSAPPPPGLRHIIRGVHRHQGTWIPASCPASLCISHPGLPSAVPVLTISIGDVVFEEHFVSILNFSWPQVTCVTQCPIRGSMVVFVSFCDKSKQIQKFAVRFPQLCDAESFLSCVKEGTSVKLIEKHSLNPDFVLDTLEVGLTTILWIGDMCNYHMAGGPKPTTSATCWLVATIFLCCRQGEFLGANQL